MSDALNAEMVSSGYWAMSNAQADDLLVWLEPWAEEFLVPARSWVMLEMSNASAGAAPPEVDLTATQVTVWATGGGLVKVSIDGIVQPSGSALVAFPDVPGFSTKTFLNLVFQGHPSANVGGRNPVEVVSEPTSHEPTG